jgi:hypothetical protein
VLDHKYITITNDLQQERHGDTAACFNLTTFYSLIAICRSHIQTILLLCGQRLQRRLKYTLTGATDMALQMECRVAVLDLFNLIRLPAGTTILDSPQFCLLGLVVMA